jgi:hypothetical protein
MSVVLATSLLEVSNLFSLSAAIALGVQDFFSSFVFENVFINGPTIYTAMTERQVEF